MVFLGVPEQEVQGQELLHHQLLQDYTKPQGTSFVRLPALFANLPIGNGNNMFISISSPGDTLSAPTGYRAVMISTHCEVIYFSSKICFRLTIYSLSHGKLRTFLQQTNTIDKNNI